MCVEMICELSANVKEKIKTVLRFSLAVFSWTVLLRCFSYTDLCTGILGVKAETAEVTRMTRIVGDDVFLRCDTQPSQPTDVLELVAWYKNDYPVYSYDSRLEESKAHWSDKSLEDRADWQPGTLSSSLRIRDVIATDRALYRCRVDFKTSNTVNHKIFLDIIELPGVPEIFDDFKHKNAPFAGPYAENSTMKLTCIVYGGNPPPRVRWFRNDRVVATLPPAKVGSGTSLLVLQVLRLTRDYNDNVCYCTADNTILAPPQKAKIRIHIYLRPLLVEILTKDQPLSVDQRTELTCRVAGSWPPALITWWLDDVQIPSIEKDSNDLNTTISVLAWTPRMEHNGKTLVCRATNQKLKLQAIETSIILDLYYVPITEIQLGSNLSSNDIEEGDDVYLECLVTANPQPYKVVWEYKGHVIGQNKKTSILRDSFYLAFQEVSRNRNGPYACIASNIEGDGRSPEFDLKVSYEPACKTSVPLVVRATINEPARMSCEVDAFPHPTSYQWITSNTESMMIIENDKYTTADSKSLLTFTPTSKADYGIFTCRAYNQAGLQLEPCRFSLLPPMRPDSLTNCITNDLTNDSAEVTCIPGSNGGLHTIYFVEAWEYGKLILNLSNPTPAWWLRGLSPGQHLKLKFYGINASGRSEMAYLKIRTLSSRTSENEHWKISNRSLATIAGVAATFIAVMLMAILVKKCHKQPTQCAAPVEMIERPKALPDSGQHLPLTPDEINPNLVNLKQDNSNDHHGLLSESLPPLYQTGPASQHGFLKRVHSLHIEPHTGDVAPSSDTLSIGAFKDDWPLCRGREVVTTRSALLILDTQDSSV